jgi:MSHA biogenesis protein MshQ
MVKGDAMQLQGNAIGRCCWCAQALVFAILRTGIVALGVLASIAGGVQGATYTSASTPFSWIDASTHTKVGYNTTPYKFNGGSGCGTTPPVLDDTLSDVIPIGFSFVYGTTTYTTLRIMTNGRLQFANTTCGAGTNAIGPPQTYPYLYPIASMNNTMKIFGVDLDPTNLVDKPNYPTSTSKTNCLSSATCYISYASIGTAPNRQFVVTWWHVPEWVTASNTSGSFDLQMILNENGTFIYQFGTITHGGTGQAQIGWQLSTTDYEVLTFGAAAEPPPNTAIVFYKPSAGPIAEYRFDDGAWSPNGAGQVSDSSGNNRPGMALGRAQETAAGYLCRGAAIPANTTASPVDAVQTGINMSNTSLNMLGQGTIMFWYKSGTAWNGGTAAQLIDATEVDGQWFYLTKTATGTLYFQVMDSSGTSRSVETSAQTFAANTWVHVAITWNFNASPTTNQDRLNILINAGSPTTSSFTSSGTVTSSAGYVRAGDNAAGFVGTKGTLNSANGTLDELRFYNFELNQGQVAGARAESRACPTFAIDHLELRHASWTGSACSPGTLNIVACANASCSSLYTSGVIATLSSSGAATIWDAASGGSEVIIGNTQSSTTKDFYTAVGTANFNIVGTGAPVSPSNPKKCNDSSATCLWTSTSGGLLLTVPNSGVIVGGQPTGVGVQAVQSTGATPGAPCAPIAGLSGTGLKIWTTPSNPSSFSGTSTSAGYTVGGSPQMSSASGGSYAYTPQSTPGADNLTGLTFDSNAATTVWIKHMDTGSWSIDARLDKAASTTSPALALSGNVAVTSVPVGFGAAAATVTAVAAVQADCAAGPSALCDATAGAAAKVASAGMAFPMTVTAALWTANGDIDLSNNPVAPSYAGTVTLAPALAAPSGGQSGTLGVASVTLASGWATIASQSWSQLGAVRVFGSASYLGKGVNPAGAGQATILNPVLGRFSAHHFQVAASHACGAFTYSGQPFASVVVTAMNANATPSADLNYIGAFARLVTLSDANGFTGGNFTTAGSILATAFVSGAATVQPVYTFSAARTPPTSIKIRATDADGAVSSLESASEIRSGRLWLGSAYGSEYLPLEMPIQMQYWNNGWRQNDSDSCTVLTVPSAGNGGLINALATRTSASYTLSPPPGSARLRLSAPGAGNVGVVDVVGSVIRGSASWLPPHTAFGRACFGACGPRSPVIYFRERF